MRNLKYDTQEIWRKDRDHYIHPWTDFATFHETGSDVIAEGDGIYVYDSDGRRYIDGIGGLWWVLSGDRPSAALTLASWLCPLGVLYVVMTVLVARPGSQESADPLIPFLVIAGAFGFTIAAMLVPLVSEFDVAMGRTSGGAD